MSESDVAKDKWSFLVTSRGQRPPHHCGKPYPVLGFSKVVLPALQDTCTKTRFGCGREGAGHGRSRTACFGSLPNTFAGQIVSFLMQLITADPTDRIRSQAS